VTKTTGGAATYYVYGAGGELLAEYGGASKAVGGTVYQTEDALGSTRAVTSATGSIVSRSDYLPFGETMAGTATFNRNQFLGYGPAEGTSLTFTEHVGDAESALDYFGARYFASAMGRFSSVDRPFADQHPASPQSWSLYSYTLNNPLRYVDPDGRGVLEGLKRGIDSIGVGMITLVLKPDRVAAGAWHAASHPIQTGRSIAAGLNAFAHSSLDEKVTSVVSFAVPAVLGGGAGALGAGAGVGGITTLGSLGEGSTAAASATALTEAGGNTIGAILNGYGPDTMIHITHSGRRVLLKVWMRGPTLLASAM
jgi:RHS repeat-associated protein